MKPYSRLAYQTIKVAALAGGVGGAKLVVGLANCLPPENLSVIVNTGDDFTHFGLRIRPDLDSVMYALGDLQDPTRGWGLAGDTNQVLQALRTLGAPDWFQLGDKDLATHLERTRCLAEGLSLTETTLHLCARLGIRASVLPMSDDPAPTFILTRDGRKLAFQEYFVREHFEPEVAEIDLEAAGRAKPTRKVMDALMEADLVVLCPSNPWVSIDPILRVAGLRDLVQEKPVVAVSPLIQGKAVKGPAAKMFAELGIEPTALQVLAHYGNLVSAFVLDELDALSVQNSELKDIILYSTNTLMQCAQHKFRLADEVLRLGLLVLNKSEKHD